MVVAPLRRAHDALTAGYQLLGRRLLRAALLAELVPYGCREAAIDDGSARRQIGRRSTTVPGEVDGSSERHWEEGWTEGILERLRTLLLTGLPSERHGVAGL